MELVVFAFKNTIASKTLDNLEVGNKYYIESNYDSLDDFANSMLKDNPKYVLGLGMYSRIDKDKLRIETHYNKNKKKYPMSNFLLPVLNTKLAQGIGNSYCNYVSKEIMERIIKKKLQTQYTFIHIPKTYDAKKAATEIQKMIQ